jgi:hypothetical protein
MINQQNKYPEGMTMENPSLPPLYMAPDVKDFQSEFAFNLDKIGTSFDNINRMVNDTLNDQIRTLRSEVHKNHRELNDLIFNLQVKPT